MSKLSRRERKKLETRDRIVDCAAALFADRSYDSTTMEDIGDCADVARATVFNYFGRKEDLVVAWFERRRGELAKTVVEGGLDASDTPSRLRRAYTALAQLFEDDPAVGRAMMRAWLQAGGPLLTPESETTHLFADMIRTGQHQGDITPNIDAEHAGRVLFDAYLGVMHRWVNDMDAHYALQENLLTTLELLLAGMTRFPTIDT